MHKMDVHDLGDSCLYTFLLIEDLWVRLLHSISKIVWKYEFMNEDNEHFPKIFVGQQHKKSCFLSENTVLNPSILVFVR